jgi:hypothetical protein
MPSLNTGNAILSNALKVDSSYNVGIGGAASGSFKLQVTGNGILNNASGMALQVNGGTFTQATASSYSLGIGNTGGFDLTLGTSSAAGIIQTWSSKPLSLNPQGNNVLIGSTTDSSYKLDVTGTVRFSTTLLVSGAATFSSSIGVGTALSINSGVAVTSYIQLNYTAIDARSKSWRIWNDAVQYGDFVISQATSVGSSSYASRFLITTDGYTGIGANTPQTFLHVLGTNTSARGQLCIQSNNTSNAAKATWYYDTFNSGEIGSTGADFYALATNNFLFYAGGSPIMTITSGGNVNILKSQNATTTLLIQNTNDGVGAAAELRFYGNESGSVKNNQQISFVRGSGGVDWAIGQPTDSNDFVIAGGTNQGDGKPSLTTAEKLRIYSGGSVGVTNSLSVSGVQIRHINSSVDAEYFKNGNTTIAASGGTITYPIRNGSLVYIVENNTGTGGLFFATYASGTITLIADPSGFFATSDTANRICFYKSANNPNATIKNNRTNTNFTLYQFSVSD